MNLFLILTLSLITTGYSQCEYELKTESLADVKFENSCIENHINSFESLLMLQILDSKVVEDTHGLFLLSKVRVDHKETWIYIMPLNRLNNTIRLSNDEILNACKSEELSIETFSIKDGQIDGCESDNHKISVKQ